MSSTNVTIKLSSTYVYIFALILGVGGLVVLLTINETTQSSTEIGSKKVAAAILFGSALVIIGFQFGLQNGKKAESNDLSALA